MEIQVTVLSKIMQVTLHKLYLLFLSCVLSPPPAELCKEVSGFPHSLEGDSGSLV